MNPWSVKEILRFFYGFKDFLLFWTLRLICSRFLHFSLNWWNISLSTHYTKNESFSLRISLVNVTKSAVSCHIWSHILKKSLMENFTFCGVKLIENFRYIHKSGILLHLVVHISSLTSDLQGKEDALVFGILRNNIIYLKYFLFRRNSRSD